MQNLFVIEGFYTAENFGLMSNFQRTCNMKGLHVPQNIYYPSRLEAFPTWESDDFEKVFLWAPFLLSKSRKDIR